MKYRIDDSDLGELVRLTFDLLCLADNPAAAAEMAMQRLGAMTGAVMVSLGTAPTARPQELRAVQRLDPNDRARKRPAIQRLLRSDPVLRAAVDLSLESISQIIHPTTRLQRDLLGRPEAKAAATLRAAAGLGAGLYSVLPIGVGRVSVVSLHQGLHAQKKWGAREVKLLDLLHADLVWLTMSVGTAGKIQSAENILPRPMVLTLALSRRTKRSAKRLTTIPRSHRQTKSASGPKPFSHAGEKLVTPSAA